MQNRRGTAQLPRRDAHATWRPSWLAVRTRARARRTPCECCKPSSAPPRTRCSASCAGGWGRRGTWRARAHDGLRAAHSCPGAWRRWPRLARGAGSGSRSLASSSAPRPARWRQSARRWSSRCCVGRLPIPPPPPREGPARHQARGCRGRMPRPPAQRRACLARAEPALGPNPLIELSAEL
ncbi:hypothetical protein T492DRAFT_1020209 [Pavlovales sp. CCMP2436]|nr:hypothetical protein T492DRAFT_1020209 [Pavlovales sp. CCMP2436]